MYVDGKSAQVSLALGRYDHDLNGGVMSDGARTEAAG